MKKNKKSVAVGLSGGVDSSVSAALLKKQGYAVTGVYIKIWSDPKIPCTLKDDRYDAMRVATALNIPLKTWDFSREYKKAVVDYMIDEYRKYRTPNPDVVCNRDIKFGLFLKKAREQEFDYIATGHHVRLRREFPISNFQFPNKFKIPARLRLRANSLAGEQNSKLFTAKDTNKDQSYFLWTLTQEQLKYCLFPIGEYRKVQVRKLAKKFALPTAEKKDSQGICFIGQIDIAKFLKKYIPQKSGTVITTTGKVVGTHDGLYYYTIGQRHGLGIGGGTPYYVVEKDVKKNILIVGNGSRDPALFKRELIATDCNWISGTAPTFPLKCQARIRYRQPLQSCRIAQINADSNADKRGKDLDKSAPSPAYIRVRFSKPQRAVAPGQSIVFYSGNEVLGGGVIEKTK